MIEFSCPKCDARIKIGEESAGRAGKCKTCGSKIVVPSPEQTDWLSEHIPPPIAQQAVANFSSYSNSAIPPKKPAARKKSSSLVYALLFVALFSVVGIASAAIIVVRPSIFGTLFSSNSTPVNANVDPNETVSNDSPEKDEKEKTTEDLQGYLTENIDRYLGGQKTEEQLNKLTLHFLVVVQAKTDGIKDIQIKYVRQAFSESGKKIPNQFKVSLLFSNGRWRHETEMTFFYRGGGWLSI